MPSAAPESSTDIHLLTVQSPVGTLILSAQNGALTGLSWATGLYTHHETTSELLTEAESQLAAYFDSRLKDFNLPLAVSGTKFQSRVWRAIDAIPFGATLTYGGLAKKLRTGPRAVAGACGANPIPIIVPCHRVLSTTGNLCGYSGHGGILTKATLLNLEGIRANV